MPFTSKSQLRTCYGRRPKGWNCDQWLRETPSVCRLPERKPKSTSRQKPMRRRAQHVNEKIKGRVQTGPRGGRYFVITEKDRRGVKCQVKVYLR